jgi:hypothetical protein
VNGRRELGDAAAATPSGWTEVAEALSEGMAH